MKTTVLLVLFFAAAQVLSAQQQNDENRPDEQIVVKKKFNEKGELIGYDSTAVYTWKTDTSFSFGFSGDSLLHDWNFPGIEQFMYQFGFDSIAGNPRFYHQPFTFGFRFSPFDDPLDDHALTPFSDSLFSKEFPFRFDSLFFNFEIDPGQNFDSDFSQKFMEDFEEQMNQHFFRHDNSQFPRFDNENHRKEWEQLMEKHRSEIEQLRNKWKEQEKEE